MPRFLFVAVIFAASHAAGREIPVSEIFTTSNQEDLQGVRSESADERAWYRIQRTISGASNAFLVDASKIEGAISTTARVFAGIRAADLAVPAYGNSATRNYWLVVYLGAGRSNPTTWIVNSATIDDDRIRLTYRSPKHNGGTMDVKQYFYWIPLGKLDKGVYHLELFNADLMEATLMRRVEVKAQ